LSSDHIVILGGSSGIGLATARRLRDAGHRVTIAGRDPQRLAAAKQSLGDVAAHALDAADPARVRAFFRGAGAIDHLVLTFGSRCGVGPFASVSLDDVRKGFEEKVFPQFSCAQAALPTLCKDGSLTFLSAISARRGAGHGGHWRGQCGDRSADANSRRRAQAAARQLRLAGRDRHALVGFPAAGTESAGLRLVRRPHASRPGRPG
jgi:NAD(P)-dependent dehydrogenase (short-subunit alcohol dehydrogenase family)